MPPWLGRLVAELPRVGELLAGEMHRREDAARAEGVDLGGRRGRQAAVLVLFGPGDGPGGISGDVVLTERASGLRAHSGQVSFPGGGLEPGDGGDPVRAALREAREEVGLDAAGVQVLGTAPALRVPPTGTSVVPVMAFAPRPQLLLAADPSEVAQVLRVPLAALTDPGARAVVRTRSGWRGPTFTVAAPEGAPLVVWGFTAIMLDVLLRLAGLEEPWDTGREVPLASVSGASELPGPVRAQGPDRPPGGAA